MLKRTLLTVLFALACCAGCFAQSSYKGLTPGRSTRADVERALGEPVGQVSETLIEYAPQSLTGKIFVQYRAGSPAVERIEFLCRTEGSTCDELLESLRLRLPEEPDGDRSEGERWRYLYGAPLYVVTSGPAADASGDGPTPTRVALYSRDLFETEMAKAKRPNKATTVTSGPDDSPATSTPVGESRTITVRPAEGPVVTAMPSHIGVDGVVRVASAGGSERPVPGATVEFYRTDRPGYIRTEADDNGVFSYNGLPPDATWVIVVSGRGIRWAYAAGVKAPDSGLEIIAERGDGARPTREQVMAVIR